MKLIISAMKDEIKVLLTSLPFKKYNNDLLEMYKYKDILVAISKIGEVNAAFALTNILKDFKITAIYNIGTVGSLKEQYQVFDIVEVSQAVYLFADATPFGYQYGQIPKEKAIFQHNKNLLQNKITLPHVFLGTSDVFIHNDYYLQNVQKNFHQQIDIVDMEGAAFFQVANKFNIAITAIKVISDHIITHQNKKSSEQFNFNLTKITAIIANFVLQYII